MDHTQLDQLIGLLRHNPGAREQLLRAPDVETRATVLHQLGFACSREEIPSQSLLKDSLGLVD